MGKEKKRNKRIIFGSIIIISVILLLIILYGWQFAIKKEQKLQNPNQSEIKYFDWEVLFIIYNNSANSPAGFPPEPIFNVERDKILHLIPESEYTNYSRTWNGFTIFVTQEGYEIIKKDILGKYKSPYLGSIRSEMIIDQTTQKTPKNEEEIYNCIKNRECIKVDDVCCGCGGAGKERAINRDYYNFWQNKRAKECEGRGCFAMMSNDWTCFAEPKCVNGKCTLVK